MITKRENRKDYETFLVKYTYFRILFWIAAKKIPFQTDGQTDWPRMDRTGPNRVTEISFFFKNKRYWGEGAMVNKYVWGKGPI